MGPKKKDFQNLPICALEALAFLKSGCSVLPVPGDGIFGGLKFTNPCNYYIKFVEAAGIE